jgi:hypothetical protein
VGLHQIRVQTGGPEEGKPVTLELRADAGRRLTPDDVQLVPASGA